MFDVYLGLSRYWERAGRRREEGPVGQPTQHQQRGETGEQLQTGSNLTRGRSRDTRSLYSSLTLSLSVPP